MTMTTIGRFMAFTNTNAGSLRRFLLSGQVKRQTTDMSVYHNTPLRTKGTRLFMIGQSPIPQFRIPPLSVVPDLVSGIV
jgi:hypothetical protein